jgi:hypothetical protein
LYKLTDAGTFTVLDVDAYASAVTTLQAANTVGTNLAFEARNITTIGQTVLTDASLTAEPAEGGRAIVSLTITNAAATAVAGDISFLIEYTM